MYKDTSYQVVPLPNPCTVLICGGRDYNDQEAVTSTLVALQQDVVISKIIHGDARGADTLADIAARQLNIEVVPFPADWQKHGKAAGVIRNAEMLLQCRPHVVLAFPGGRGTQDMVNRATKAGIPVILCGIMTINTQ